jgi:hypothetical protein
MGIWDEFVDPLKKAAEDMQAPPAPAAPPTPVSAGPEGPLPEPKYGPGDVPFAKPVVEPSTPVGDAAFQEPPPNYGTQGESGDLLKQALFESSQLQAPLGDGKPVGAGGAVGRAAVPMAVAPANVNYAPVGGKNAFDTAYGELPAMEKDALGDLHNTTAEGLKAQAESKAEEANQLAQMAENSRLREEQRSKALMEHVANYTRMADQMAAQRFDAGRYWKNPGNVLAAFSMSLLPLAGVSPEKALGLVDAAVQRDWSAQQIDYERAQNRAAAELSTIGQLRSIYGDERAAEDAFRAQSYKAMAAKAQSVALRGQSEEQRKLATLLASQYATQAAQSQARANATLYQGAHLAPAQLVGAQVREGEKVYTDPAVNALYGRKDQIPQPPAPGEAPGDNPVTGMPDHPPTKEERNAAAVQAALARFRGTPVPPEVQSVLDASKRVAGGTKELLSPLTGMLGIGGPDAEPAASAAPASSTGSVMSRARANLGLPTAQSTAQPRGNVKATDIEDPAMRVVLVNAERIYGGPLPSDLAQKLSDKYRSDVQLRPSDRAPGGKTGNLSSQALSGLEKDLAYAKSDRGKADQRFADETSNARQTAANVGKESQRALYIQAARDAGIELETQGERKADGQTYQVYKLDKAGFPVPKNKDPKTSTAFRAAIEQETGRVETQVKDFNDYMKGAWRGVGFEWVDALKAARTQQQLLEKKLGGRDKVDTAMGYLRNGTAADIKGKLRLAGIMAEPEDILRYKSAMDNLKLIFSNVKSGSAMSEEEIKRHGRVLSGEAAFPEQVIAVDSLLSSANATLAKQFGALSPAAKIAYLHRNSATLGKRAQGEGAYRTPGQ